MKFKVGDKVRIRNLEEESLHTSVDGKLTAIRYTERMKSLAGKVYTIKTVRESEGVDYRLVEEEAEYMFWTEDMLEFARPLNTEEELAQVKSLVEEYEKRIAILEAQLNIQKIQGEYAKYIGKLVWCWDEEYAHKHIDIYMGHRDVDYDGEYPHETQHSYYTYISPITEEEMLELIYEEE